MPLPLLAALLSLIGARFMLFHPGHYYNMQDDMQLIRQMEFESCLKDGQIPCRWTPRLGYGYGYPEFNFYPPLPYIVGQVFRTVGLSYLETVKYGAVVQFIAAALAMYLLASSVFGPLGGLLSSVFYSFAPYHALNIFVRGAYNEAWASVFFPLIFHFSRQLILRRRSSDFWLLSLSVSGLLLSHNPMALIFLPPLAVWCLFWFLKTKDFIKILPLSLAGLFGLCLSAFFTLPLLFETKYVQIETMFRNYFDFRAHFVSLNQLFISNFWGDGPSVWQEADGMSFMVGYLHWLLPLLLLLYFFFRLLRRQKISSSLFLSSMLILFAGFYLFLTHSQSTPVWLLLPPIQKIQFPWRFLNPSLFLLSLSVGILPLLLKKLPSNKIKIIIGVLVFLVIALNFSHFYPVTSGAVSEKDKFSGQSWINQITSGIYDYLPKTAATAAKKAAVEYVDLVDPAETKYEIYGQKHGTDWLFFNIHLDRSAKVYLSQLYFPNFKITDFGREINFDVDPELGRMVVSLTPGHHQLYLRLHSTPIRIIANCLSLFSWSFMFLYWLNPPWKPPKSKA